MTLNVNIERYYEYDILQYDCRSHLIMFRRKNKRSALLTNLTAAPFHIKDITPYSSYSN